MSEHDKDDTPEAPAGSLPERSRKSGRSYYYDDATGYEVYDPAEEEQGNKPETNNVNDANKNSDEEQRI